MYPLTMKVKMKINIPPSILWQLRMFILNTFFFLNLAVKPLFVAVYFHYAFHF